MRRILALVFLIFIPLLLMAQDVLRGEVMVEMEPITYRAVIERQGPLEDERAYRQFLNETAYRLALERAAMLFSAQIYGWSFYYDIGERARGIAEEFELTPLGEIPWGDPRLVVTHASFHNHVLSMWADYRPSEAQSRRLEMWRMGRIRTVQAIGRGPLSNPMDFLETTAIQRAALEDSARAAVRALLQAEERNRPKEARGYISLQIFPTFWMDAGQWTTQARFRVEITEIVPFAVH